MNGQPEGGQISIVDIYIQQSGGAIKVMLKAGCAEWMGCLREVGEGRKKIRG